MQTLAGFICAAYEVLGLVEYQQAMNLRVAALMTALSYQEVYAKQSPKVPSGSGGGNFNAKESYNFKAPLRGRPDFHPQGPGEGYF